MRILALALPVAFVGCTHADFSARSGPVVSGAAVQVTAYGPVSAVLLAGMLAAAAREDFSEPPPSFADRGWDRPAPMQPDREINEQDCTKPIALTGNLRCK